MSVDYEQELLDNEAEKKTAIEKSNAAYDETISDYQTEVDKQQQQLKDYEAQQKSLQQEQTDFAIDKINQQKEQAEKDYTKEQQAAYGDYKKQTDPYGVNAEQMASLGLSQSGYSESSNVAMYTAYQNRVAAARASIEQAKLTFDNAIREAKLTNDINMAKIAQETLEKSLALSMESVVYLGNLQLQKAADARTIEQTYYGREQEIRAAQKEAMESDGFLITDDEAITAELSAAYPSGVIADTDVWNELVGQYGEETVRGWGYQPADQGPAPTSAQGAATSQAQQPKYNYSDERVNAYFTQKDAVDALREEYNSALDNLNNLTTKYRNNVYVIDNAEEIIATQQKYVDEIRKQLLTENGKLLSMTKPTESSVYLSRDSECKKAKEAYETAKRELASLQGSGVSAGALRSAEEKVRNARIAYEKAKDKARSVERYVISG